MPVNVIGFGQRTLSNAPSQIELTSGGLYTIPSGQYHCLPGPLSFLQWYDPITTMWRVHQTPAQSDSFIITSDGTNWRLANLTGTVVGAVVTNGGTGYTNGIYYPAGFPIAGNPSAVQQGGTAAAPSVTFAAGGGSILAQANLVVGGAINTTITITAGGSGFTRAPTLILSAPPAGGVQATATCTISAGAINAVTVTNQGGGYAVAPTVTIVNGQGDTTGTGAVLTVNATLAQSGAIVAITPVNNGAGMTSVPAITFAPASTSAATAIMCFTATTVTWAGASNAGNGNFGIINSVVTAGSSTTTNPAITTGLFTPRPGFTAMSTTASPTTTVINDGGLHQTVPNAVLVMNSNGTISGATTTTIAQGGATDRSYLLPL
jgi:hypothetical protein